MPRLMRCSSLLAAASASASLPKVFEVAILLAGNHFLAPAKLSVIPKRLHAVIGIAGATGPAVLIAIDARDFNRRQALALSAFGRLRLATYGR